MITSTIIGMSYESNKNAHLFFHLGAIFIRLNALGRVSKLTQLMSIFTSNFFFQIFDKNSADSRRARSEKYFP